MRFKLNLNFPPFFNFAYKRYFSWSPVRKAREIRNVTKENCDKNLHCVTSWFSKINPIFRRRKVSILNWKSEVLKELTNKLLQREVVEVNCQLRYLSKFLVTITTLALRKLCFRSLVPNNVWNIMETHILCEFCEKLKYLSDFVSEVSRNLESRLIWLSQFEDSS